MKKILVFSVLVLLCVSFATVDALFGFTRGRGETVAIPNFCGLSEEAVTSPDWITLQSEYRHDATTERGTVIAQNPPAGTEQRVQKDRLCEVTLVISLGDERAEVPRLVGLDAREAASRLRALGFSVREEAVAGGVRGTVKETLPSEGEMLSTGAEVTLRVFRGTDTKTVHVPDLTGLTVTQASFEVYLAELKLGEVRIEGTVAPEQVAVVLRQLPTAGSYVASGTAVSVTLAVAESDSEAKEE